MGKRGPQPWKPTEEERKRIRMYAGLGITQEQIATLIGKCVDTLADRCREDLDAGAAEAKAKVGGAIVKAALAGNMTAAIFYAKTQMGWKETERHEHSGPNGAPIPHMAMTADEFEERARKVAQEF
jgi:hypothetical protein